MTTTLIGSPRRTRKGRIKGMWTDIKVRCTSQRPAWLAQGPARAKYFGMPYPTLEDFTAWIKKNEDFDRMWRRYRRSGFNSALNPTIDRLDGNEPGQGKGYVFDNMRVLEHYLNSGKTEPVALPLAA